MRRAVAFFYFCFPLLGNSTSTPFDASVAIVRSIGGTGDCVVTGVVRGSSNVPKRARVTVAGHIAALTSERSMALSEKGPSRELGFGERYEFHFARSREVRELAPLLFIEAYGKDLEPVSVVIDTCPAVVDFIVTKNKTGT